MGSAGVSRLAFFLATLPVATRIDAQAPACTEPGNSRWSIKTSLPAGAVYRHRKKIDLQTILDLPPPAGAEHPSQFATTRFPDSPGAGLREGDLVEVKAYFRLVATESNDCDYHMQISVTPDTSVVAIVEVAKNDAASIHTGWIRTDAGKVRTFVRDRLLEGSDPTGTGNLMQHEVFVRIVGQLFYDAAHGGNCDSRGKKGMHAANCWELHPVISLGFTPKPAP